MVTILSIIGSVILFYITFSVIIEFGGWGILFLLVLCSGVIAAIIIKDKLSSKGSNPTELQDVKVDEVTDDELYNKIISEESIPHDHIKICLINSEIGAPCSVPYNSLTPAFMWKEDGIFKVLPVGINCLRFSLKPQETKCILVKADDYFDKTGLIPPMKVTENYKGLFASRFKSVAQSRKYVIDTLHPEYLKRFASQYDNYGLKANEKMDRYCRAMEAEGYPPMPICHHFGNYIFGQYFITLPSAKLIHERFGIPYKAISHYPPNQPPSHPRSYKHEIDAYKAMLNDGIINIQEYDSCKREYLEKVSVNSDGYKRSELSSLLSVGLITRAEANYYLENQIHSSK